MNKIVNKFLLARDKFMRELHLRQPEYIYSCCGLFNKHRERIKKFKEIHDAAYSDSKGLAKRTVSDKVLKDRAYEIAINPKYNGYQRGLAYKFFEKKTGSGASVNEELAEELHKPVIKIFKRGTVHMRIRDNIWAVDLAEMESLSSKNQFVRYLFVLDVFTKYAWVEPLKDKKAKTVCNGFIEAVNESKSKPNKLWVDQGRKFYNNFYNFIKEKWLDHSILMYSTHNEGKSVVAERFIRTLKGKIYEKMTANDRKFYHNYLNKLANEYNNTYYCSTGKKPINADYAAFFKEIETNHKAPKFKVGDRVRITKYKNIFSKGYTENWSK